MSALSEILDPGVYVVLIEAAFTTTGRFSLITRCDDSAAAITTTPGAPSLAQAVAQAPDVWCGAVLEGDTRGGAHYFGFSHSGENFFRLTLADRTNVTITTCGDNANEIDTGEFASCHLGW